MTGEVFALVSACFYGLGSVTIVKGRETASGDNGVFLSVLTTTFLTFVLYLFSGPTSSHELWSLDGQKGLALFVLAGILSTALGRSMMYRSTALIGAVNASLLRRLIPVFSVPCAILLLWEFPDIWVIAGGATILFGVFYYTNPGSVKLKGLTSTGLIIGAGSAICYALAYALRRLGLEFLPEPVLGTFVGACAGGAWILVGAAYRRKLNQLVRDLKSWHWASALLLSLGQLFQFFALQLTSVSRVASIGSLDFLFAAVLAAYVFRTEKIEIGRFVIAISAALIGTMMMFA